MDVERLINFEERVADLFRDKKIHVPIHLSGSVDGSYERKLIDIFKDIRSCDYVLCTWRNHLHYLLKGGSEQKLIDEILGLGTGICGGSAGSMHIIDHKLRFYSSAIVGGTPSIAAGLGLAIKRAGLDEQVYCFIGDGGLDSGHFYEAYRYVIGWDLPVTFVIEDNDRSVCTSKATRWGRCPNIEDEERIIYISFEAKWPHAGIGEFIPL